jgi:hypothetical protein
MQTFSTNGRKALQLTAEHAEPAESPYDSAISASSAVGFEMHYKNGNLMMRIPQSLGLNHARRLTCLGAVLLFVVFAADPMSSQTNVGGDDVTRATLDNGLRVVIIRDPLAPVVTVEDNYIVGANETPAGFPGMAPGRACVPRCSSASWPMRRSASATARRCRPVGSRCARTTSSTISSPRCSWASASLDIFDGD